MFDAASPRLVSWSAVGVDRSRLAVSERGPIADAVVGVAVLGRVEDDVIDVDDDVDNERVVDVVDDGATVVVGEAVVVVVGGKNAFSTTLF